MKRLYLFLAIIMTCVSLSGEITRSGTLVTETWSEDVHITADATIGSGVTITIASGVTVRMDADVDIFIIGTGILLADASSGSAIKFTAYNGVSWGHISFSNTTATTDSKLINCIIELGDVHLYSKDLRWGGGVRASSSKLQIKNCLFQNNNAYVGGGLFVDVNQSPIVENCHFKNNIAGSIGGGICIRNNSSVKVKNCLFEGNTAQGVVGSGGALIGPDAGNAKLINCTFVNNTSPSSSSGANITMYYNTVSPKPQIINCILWGSNNSVKYSGQTPQTSDFVNCAIQGTIIANSSTNSISLSSTNNNPTGPNFVATDGSDWSIIMASPCVDKGIDNSSDSDVPLTDYLGNSRIGVTDIGAYECQVYTYIWQGDDATFPTYWNVGANWNANSAPPNSTVTIIIPSGLSNYPIGTSPDYTIGSSHDFTVEAGARVTFNSLTNNGNLYLNASSSGFASMIVSNYTRGSGGTESIQLHLAGGGDEDLDNFKWHYISSPVSTISTSVFTGVTYDLAQYIESRPTLSLLQGWVAYDGYQYSNGNMGGPTFSSLSPGKGYDFWDNADNTFTFSGLFNTSNVVVSLAYSGTPSLSGFNLLGNPFMSGLDWNAVVNGTYFAYPANTSKGLYFTRDNVQCSYINGVGIPGDVTGIIPPMQGFFTKTYSTGNSITLAAAARTNSGIHATYKGYTEIPLIRLQLTKNSDYLDETVVRFDESAKSTLDYDFDAIKFNIANTKNQIYSVSSGVEYAINGQPLPDPTTITTIPLTINITSPGTYEINLKQYQALGNFEVGLVDKIAGDTIDIWKHSPYVFTSTAGTFADRFSIVVGEDVWTGIENPEVPKRQFNIYQAGNEISLVPLTDDWNGKLCSVKVIDLSGRNISNLNNIELTTDTPTMLKAPLTSGLYLVEVRTGVRRYVGKIIIRK